MLMEPWQQGFSGVHKPMRGDPLEAEGQDRRENLEEVNCYGRIGLQPPGNSGLQ